MWHLRMVDAHNASQEHERVVGFFPIFSIEQCRRERFLAIPNNSLCCLLQCRSFLPNPEPEIKPSLTHRTATVHVVKSALAPGLSAPHHHSLAPSSITISSIPQTTEQLVTSHLRLSIATEISIDSQSPFQL